MSREDEHDRIARYLEGALSAPQAEALEAALREDEQLADALDEERALFSALSRPPPRVDVVDAVQRRLAETNRPRRSWPTWLAVAAALTGVTLLIAPEPPPPTWLTRADAPADTSRWLGVRVLTMTASGLEAVHDAVDADAEVVLAYRNLGVHPARSLMVFAVDAAGQVRWYYPAWVDAATNPRALPIREEVADELLPDAVRHELPAGPLELHALFLDVPWSVREVEARLAAGSFDDARLRHHQTIRLEVR